MRVRYRVLAPLLALVVGTAHEASSQDVKRGAVLMAAARQAIGGDARLKEVKTLQLAGTFRRVIDGNDTDGDFEVFVELPDNYLRSEKTGTPGQPSTETIEALVGGEVRDVVRGGGGRGGRGGGNAEAGGDSDSTAGGGDAAPGGDDDVTAGGDSAGPATEAGPGPGRGNAVTDSEAQRRTRRADVARLLLMWLMTGPTPMAWVGIAEAPDGKADVLEARLADGQPTRLFLDAVSHVPLMLQWQGMPIPAGGRRGGGGQRGQGRGGAPAGAAQRQGDPPAPITFDLKFSDHRTVNGIRLPYVVTRGINGQTVERWSIRSYRINPAFNAATFTR